MKIAILFDSKYGNTKKLAGFLAKKVVEMDHEVQLFQTGQSKPEDLLKYLPEVLLIGAPTHVGSPARALNKYIKKMKKLIEKATPFEVKRAGVFNCNNGVDVCHKIYEYLIEFDSNIKIFEKGLPIHTGDMKGGMWEVNWEQKSTEFIDDFLKFIS